MKIFDLLKLATFIICPALLFINSCSLVKGNLLNNTELTAFYSDNNFSNQLPVPEIVKGSNVSLTTQRTTSPVNGNSIGVLGYHKGILGPTIVAERGEQVSINLKNNLEEETNIHWHGLMIPAIMDGHPENIVKSGDSFNYLFKVDQRAGMYWYHPHPHKNTAKQAYLGLAGVFLVADPEEKRLNLPSGSNEVPLVIQDKRLNGSSLTYNPNQNDIMTGFMGKDIIVNGVASPVLNVSTRFYRLRVLNGSNSRVYNLAFSNNSTFTIIGSDGGLLAAPEKINSLMLGPGERADILVDFSAYNTGTEIYLQSNPFSGSDAQGKETFKIMKFKVSVRENNNFILSSVLSSYKQIPASAATKTRKFDIKGMNMPGGHGNMGNMMGGMGMNMPMHTINGKTFDMDRIDETVKGGTTEIWEFDNTQGDEIHPMHLHGVQFQVLGRKGGRNGLISTEKGFKDTVLLMPREKVRVIMTFPDNKGKFLVHCHNLEHENDGMMLNFLIN